MGSEFSVVLTGKDVLRRFAYDEDGFEWRRGGKSDDLASRIGRGELVEYGNPGHGWSLEQALTYMADNLAVMGAVDWVVPPHVVKAATSSDDWGWYGVAKKGQA